MSQSIPRTCEPHCAGCAVVKLGGSLITADGNEGPRVEMPLLIERARELASHGQPFVLVHGTGAFGKPPARRHGYLDGHLTANRADVVSRVSRDLTKLEWEVIDGLAQGGLRPLRLSTITLFRFRHGHVVLLDGHPLAELLAQGVTPVIGGHFVLNDTEGFTVCSSDIIAVELALALGATNLILATKAHGVYRDYGRSDAIHAYISPADNAALAQLEHAGHDVSGGIRAKIANGFRAAGQGITTFVIDGRLPGNLAGALAGEPLLGTRLLPAAKLSPEMGG